MQKEDWINVARWMGYVYAPIALLILGVLLLVRAHS